MCLQRFKPLSESVPKYVFDCVRACLCVSVDVCADVSLAEFAQKPTERTEDSDCVAIIAVPHEFVFLTELQWRTKPPVDQLENLIGNNKNHLEILKPLHLENLELTDLTAGGKQQDLRFPRGVGVLVCACVSPLCGYVNSLECVRVC